MVTTKSLLPSARAGWEVYHAKDTRLGPEVAVKVLPEHLSGDAQARTRFEREAEAVAALSYPAVRYSS